MADANNNKNKNTSNKNDRKRAAPSPIPTPSPSPSKKPMWGLRQFSWRICKIVKERGITTYGQVADELCHSDDMVHADLNVRRRVYDALNVLTGLDIIQKNPISKTIQWKGYSDSNYFCGGPSSANNNNNSSSSSAWNCTTHELRQQLEQCRYRMHQQRQQLQEVLTQAVCYRNVIGLRRRGLLRERLLSSSTTTVLSSLAEHDDGGEDTTTNRIRKIPLPCLLVRTSKDCIVRCNMSSDRSVVHFDFSTPFEISDDTTILQQLGFHRTKWSDIQEILPPDMFEYCVNHSLLKGLVMEDD